MIENSDAWRNSVLLSPLIVLASLIATAGLIMLLFPLFRRFALAVPTHRSSHKALTPQWGGLPVVVVTVIAAAIANTVVFAMIFPRIRDHPPPPWAMVHPTHAS